MTETFHGTNTGDAVNNAEPLAAPAEQTSSRSSMGKSMLERIGQQWGMLIVLILMVAIFSALRPHTFPTLSNAQTILNNQVVLIFVAMAAMTALIIGGFDLSITSVLSLSGVLAIGLQGRTHLSWPVALAICLAMGVIVGWINGAIVARLRLNSFVVTLATQTIITGLITWYTGGQVLFLQIQPGFAHAAQNHIGGFVIPLFVGLATVAGLWYLFEHTPLGREMYATGSNYEAARLAGVRTRRLTIIGFVLAGLLAAFAGAVQAATVGSGQPDIGTSYLLPGFASAFLGASAVRVGRFNPVGTLLGVVLVATGFSGLVLLDVALWVQPIFYGLVLLVAIGTPRISELVKERRGRALATSDAPSTGKGRKLASTT
jgi:ribose transport system permease protein